MKVMIHDKLEAEGTYNCLFPDAKRIYHKHDDVADSDLVVLVGGYDVHPSLYNDDFLEGTVFNHERDDSDLRVHNAALLLDIPIVGICRGAQFLCVMNKGWLVQDIDNHRNCDHIIHTIEGDVLDVTGDHHQMMVPHGNYVIEAWSEGLATQYNTGGKRKFTSEEICDQGVEPEVVFWPNTKSLGVQYHPEWMKDTSAGFRYFRDLLDKYIL